MTFNKCEEKLPMSVWWAIGLLLFCGWLLHIVGFATNAWTVTEFNASGLWRFCINGVLCPPWGQDSPDWLKTVQALASVGFVLGFIAMVIIVVVHYFPHYDQWLMGSCLAAFCAGSVNLIGVIFYGAKTKTNLGYSFGLTCAGSGLMLLASVLIFLGQHFSTGRRYGEVLRLANLPLDVQRHPRERRTPTPDNSSPFPAINPAFIAGPAFGPYGPAFENVRLEQNNRSDMDENIRYDRRELIATKQRRYDTIKEPRCNNDIHENTHYRYDPVQEKHRFQTIPRYYGPDEQRPIRLDRIDLQRPDTDRFEEVFPRPDYFDSSCA